MATDPDHAASFRGGTNDAEEFVAGWSWLGRREEVSQLPDGRQPK